MEQVSLAPNFHKRQNAGLLCCLFARLQMVSWQLASAIVFSVPDSPRVLNSELSSKLRDAMAFCDFIHRLLVIEKERASVATGARSFSASILAIQERQIYLNHFKSWNRSF